MPQSTQKPLIPSLPSQCHASSDEKMQLFVGWWQRMHKDQEPLFAVALKFVEWSEAGAAAQRFIWEVCRWPLGNSSSWKFVCWMIDGDGMWTKSFPSKRAAMNYFEQAPAVVMSPSSQSVHGSPIQGMRIRRAS